MSCSQVVIKSLGLIDYDQTWQAMKRFTAARADDTIDEIWLLEHPPVFTQGQAGKPEHVINPGNIPLIETDRGGQVTYHGPGQLVVYCLLDLRRRKMGIREVVTLLEDTVIDRLEGFGINAKARADAPGVYIDGAKIASVGLRVSRGCTYHGLSFNVDMNLEPFSRINPCGLAGISVVQLADFTQPLATPVLGQEIAETICRNINADFTVLDAEQSDILEIPC